MNMFGIGNRMMRRIMKRKGIDSLETLRRQGIENGGESDYSRVLYAGAFSDETVVPLLFLSYSSDDRGMDFRE